MLREVRQSRRMSQVKLSEISGVSIESIRKYEKGMKNVNGAKLKTLCKLAIALECNISDLLTDQDTIEYLKRLSS